MGMFSWKTADTNESISNIHSTRPTRGVYLLQPNNQPPIYEPAYHGYGEFGHVDAYVWLCEMNASHFCINTKSMSDEEAMRQRGRRYAALEQARHAIELYNSWLNGQTYGIVQATFDIEETSEEPEFSFCDSEECWGFYSDDDAMDELRSQMGVLTQAAA